MIVLNENKGRLGTGFFNYCFRKAFIYPTVHIPVIGIESRTGEGYMTQRPQTLVRKAEIVSFFLLFRQPDAAQSIFRTLRRNFDVVEFVNRLFIGIAAAMRD